MENALDISSLYLYNTATRQKELFKPVDDNKVTMYVCGPTLYNNPHIGNARPLIVFDVLYRILRDLFPHVIYVRNITDIDDKIINQGRIQHLSCEQIVEKYRKVFNLNLKQLNILEPSFQPLATNHIPHMISIISKLLQNHFAYQVDGHVFFDTNKLSSYGCLSQRQEESVVAGRGNDSIVKDIKKQSQDFVLWKPSKENEPSWSTPFGEGRPGWHIECSAMAWYFLGEQFDIHGGGGDLLFPHHENEQAQTAAAFGVSKIANYWVHNAFINMNNVKMSKSLGNVLEIEQILQHHHGETLRLAIMLTHYRQPVNFSNELLIQAKLILNKLYRALLDSKVSTSPKNIKDVSLTGDTLTSYNKFKLALLNDLNLPLAIAEVQNIAKHLNKSTDSASAQLWADLLLWAGNYIGILYDDPEVWVKHSSKLIDFDFIEAKVRARLAYKQAKDYASADAIKAELLDLGVALKDRGSDHTDWELL